MLKVLPAMSDNSAYFVGTHAITKDDLKTVPFDARFPYANQVCNTLSLYIMIINNAAKRNSIKRYCKHISY